MEQSIRRTHGVRVHRHPLEGDPRDVRRRLRSEQLDGEQHLRPTLRRLIDYSVEGIYIGPLIPGPHVLISINPTGADGKPTVSPLGSGVYDAGNITLDYGPEFVQFSSVANLQKGQEYWIVIHPIGGDYQRHLSVLPESAPDVPVNSSAVVSNDNGLTWKDISNTTALISEYLLEAPTCPAATV